MRLSEKLGALCAAVVLIPMIIASVVVVMKVSTLWQEQASSQLQANARATLGLYEKRLTELRSVAQKLSSDFALRIITDDRESETARATSRAQIQDALPAAQQEFSLDFIIIADITGRVIIRHNDQPAPNETLLGGDRNPVAEKVINDGKGQRNFASSSCVVERGERLKRMNLDLRAKVDRADGTQVEDALMIEAGAPIFREGKFYGLVLIGQMVNNSFSPRAGDASLQTPLQFEARQSLYNNQDAGAVIALGDTIVASSMPASGEGDSSNRVALIGFRRDPRREEQVFEDSGRSHAVRWQPIKAIDGTDVGAIGVAVPTSRIEESVVSVRTTMVTVVILASLAAGAVGFVFGRRLGQRVETLSEAASRMSVGELSRGVEDLSTNSSRRARDEVARLAERMDEMRESFRQAIERLRKR
jgi:HAMP domain-containing protein